MGNGSSNSVCQVDLIHRGYLLASTFNLPSIASRIQGVMCMKSAWLPGIGQCLRESGTQQDWHGLGCPPACTQVVYNTGFSKNFDLKIHALQNYHRVKD